MVSDPFVTLSVRKSLKDCINTEVKKEINHLSPEIPDSAITEHYMVKRMTDWFLR